jgi:hypothetical protein
MVLPYFTILHWFAVLFFLVLFIAISILATKSDNIKMTLSIVFAGFLVTSFGGVLSVIILEKYTKKSILLDVKQRRILFNETYVIKGRVKNTGKFNINYCKFTMKMVHNGYGTGGMSKGSYFKSGGFTVFGSKDKEQERPTTVEQTFLLFKDGLKPNRSKNFSVTMKYPPYFRNTYLNYKLYCH